MQNKWSNTARLASLRGWRRTDRAGEISAGDLPGASEEPTESKQKDALEHSEGLQGRTTRPLFSDLSVSTLQYPWSSYFQY